MSPQLGQGANMALVDAAALAACAARQAVTAANWPETFAGYAQARHTHLRFYRQASRLLTPLFQSHTQSWGLVRDGLMVLARHNPLGRHHAASTLVGGRQSWWANASACELHCWDGKQQPAPIRDGVFEEESTAAL